MMELADIHCHLMPYVDDGAKDLDLNVFRGSLRDLKGLK